MVQNAVFLVVRPKRHDQENLKTHPVGVHGPKFINERPTTDPIRTHPNERAQVAVFCSFSSLRPQCSSAELL